MNDTLLTEREAAKLLCWSVSALQQRRHKNLEPSYIKLGEKSVRYSLHSLQDFIDKGRVAPGVAA